MPPGKSKEVKPFPKFPFPKFLTVPKPPREAPCQSYRRRTLEECEPYREKEPEKYAHFLGKSGIRSHWFFITEICGIEFFDEWLHGEEIFRFIDDHLGEGMMILTPRESGKSSGVTIPLPSRILAESVLSSVLICNAREDRAAKMARAAAGIIARNKKYRACYPQARESQKWGEAGYFIELNEEESEYFTSERIDPSLGSFGTTSNLTGSHISGGIFLDDLINEQIAKFPNQVRAVEEFVRESFNCWNLGATMCIIGTRWTYFDFYGKILSKEIVQKSGEAFNVLKLGVTRKDGTIIWPERTFFDQSGKERRVGYTDKSIAALKQANGKLFSALYYNEPVLEEDIQFDITKIKLFKRSPPFELGPAISVGIEIGTAQGAALKYPLLEMKRRESRAFRVTELHRGPRISKHDAIRGTLQPLISGGHFNIAEHLFSDAMPGIGRELRDFDKGSDDCLDAMEYALTMAKDPGDSGVPYVFIACDPAFSVDGDATAIVAVCKFEGEVWILDCDRFHSDRVDYIIRRLFGMYDKWCRGRKLQRRTYGIKTVGVVGANHPTFGQRHFVHGGRGDSICSQDIFWGDKLNATSQRGEDEN